MIIDCKKIYNSIFNEIYNKFNELKFIPKIVIINLNDNDSSKKYIEQKLKLSNKLNVICEVITNINSQDALINLLKKMNLDNTIHGYLIQLPLPNKFNFNEIQKYISYKKDLDGFSIESFNSLLNNQNDKYFPTSCTANAVMTILESLNLDLTGKNIVIVNRSILIGKPLFLMLLNKNATVTIAHSYTKRLSKITKKSDIVITGIAKPNFFNKKYFNKNSTIIDCGTNYKNNRIYGDVNFQKIKNKIKFITPVPNGVGSLTVLFIFKNLLDLIQNNY